MFSYAKRKEQEKTLFPLWLAQYTVKKLSKEECISFEEFLNTVLDKDKTVSQNMHQRTASEIEEELGAIVESYRQRGSS